MALSDKALALLKQIYAHRYQLRGHEQLVDEDPDEALEYVLQEIVDNLTSRLRDDASTPLFMAMESAVLGLNLDRQEHREAAQKV